MLPHGKLLADTRQQKIFDNRIITQEMRLGFLSSLRRRLARSCSQRARGPRHARFSRVGVEARFWLLGRNAAKRAQKILCRAYGCFPAANFALISLNPSSPLIRSNAASSSDLGFVIPFSRAFFSSWMACFFSPSCASAVATR